MVTVSRSLFPLRSIIVSISGEAYKLKPGDRITFDESTDSEAEVSISCDFVSHVIHLKANETKIKIGGILPDCYYFIGLSIIIALFVISRFLPSIRLFFSLGIIVFLVPVLFVLFFRKKRYFDIKVE